MNNTLTLEKERTIKFKEQVVIPSEFTYEDIISGGFNEWVSEQANRGYDVTLNIKSYGTLNCTRIFVSINNKQKEVLKFGSKETPYKERLSIAKELIDFYQLDRHTKWTLMSF